MNVIYNIIPLTQYAAVILVSSCKTLLLGEVVSPHLQSRHVTK
jgi:hypothetical protein